MSSKKPKQTPEQGFTSSSNYEGNNQSQIHNQIHNSNNDKGLEYMNQELQYKNKVIERKDAQIHSLMNKKNYVLYIAIVISLVAVVWVESIKNTPPQVAYQKKPDTVFIERTKDKKEGSNHNQSINNSVAKNTLQPVTPSSFKEPLKTTQKPIKRELKANKSIANKGAFKPNEMLELKLGKSKLLKPVQLGKIVNVRNDAIVVGFTRDSALINHPLILEIRSNNIFDEPVKRDTVVKSNIMTFYYKRDFKPGLYYLEIIDQGQSMFTTKFTVR